MKKNYLRCLVAFLLALFFVGSCPLDLSRPADAKTKKKIVRKVKLKRTKKKVVRRSKVKKVRKARKVVLRAKKKLPRARAVPSSSGTVTQDYTLEEGVGGDESDNIIGALKAVGADEVAVDSSTNTVSVTFRNSRLTSVGIVRKLKSLGYTAKRAY